MCINQVEQSEGFTWQDGRSEMNSVRDLQEEGGSAACLWEWTYRLSACDKEPETRVLLPQPPFFLGLNPGLF